MGQGDGSGDPTDGLIGRIYEAGAIPELWTDVLSELTRLAGGIGAAFLAPQSGRWLATAGIEEMMADLMTSGLIRTNERTRRLLALDPPGFARDSDIFALEDIHKEPIYQDFFIPRGGGFGTATLVEAPTGDKVIIHVERALSRGLVEDAAIAELDRLRPHLARAGLLASRLHLRHSTTTAETLAMIGIAGGVIDNAGRLIAANDLLNELVPSVVQDRRDRITLVDRRADAMLAAAIAGLNDPNSQAEAARSLALPACEGRPPAILHVVPVAGVARDVFSLASALLLITPVGRCEVPSAAVVRGLFDLTPAEARVARAIAKGDSLAEIAAGSGRAKATLRSQLKSILAKTGLRRQSELVGLLRGIPLSVKTGGAEA